MIRSSFYGRSFACSLLAVALILKHSLGRRALGRRLLQPKIAMQFAGDFYKTGDGDGTMTITRQKENLYSGKPVVFNFTEQNLHKEYVVTLPPFSKKVQKCEQAVFVRGEALPGLCGTKLFSTKNTPHLTCSRMPSSSVAAEVESLMALQPSTERGFSFEFEFVARELTPARSEKLWAYVQQEFENPSEVDRRDVNVKGVRQCFNEVIGVSDEDLVHSCTSNSDCPLTHYCLDCAKCGNSGNEDCVEFCASHGAFVLGSEEKLCYPRLSCQHDHTAVDGYCPGSLQWWNWEKDGSVAALTAEQANALGADESETSGLAFEVTAPGPPHVLSGMTGMRSTLELLASLKHMGIQAGPSQGIHLHINVLAAEAPGKVLSFKSVAHIWAAYAKYQLIIDEMLSPGRLGSRYANRLFLGNCPVTSGGSCLQDPCGCTKLFFFQMHQWLQSKGDEVVNKKTRMEFCNAVLRQPGGKKKPCTWRHPNQRYFQVNLISIAKFGTMEFRAHSASYDGERIARWGQFLIAFVEHFGADAGSAEMAEYFQDQGQADYDRLAEAQRQATSEELFTKLSDRLDAGTRDFYIKRTWEKGDAACDVPAKPLQVSGDCKPEGEGYVATILVEQDSKIRTLKVALTQKHVGSQDILVLLPSGDFWRVKLQWSWDLVRADQTAKPLIRAVLPDGTKVAAEADGLSFIFKKERQEITNLHNRIRLSNRCCCHGGPNGDETCLWYPEEYQLGGGVMGGKCPQLFPDKKNRSESHREVQITKGSTPMCATSWPCWLLKGCVKTHHFRNTASRSYCPVTEEPEAYFRGPRCSS